MTSAPGNPRRPPPATIILIVAGLIAAASAAVAISRSVGGRARRRGRHARGEGLAGGRLGLCSRMAVPEEAAAAYRRAAGIEPGNAENWSSLGEVLQSGEHGPSFPRPRRPSRRR